MTLVISREWRDEHGLPLKEEFRRVLRVGAADEKPLDTAAWRIEPPPAAGRRDALAVTFPEPLDHGLLMRALGVTRGGTPSTAMSPSTDGGDTVDLHAARAVARRHAIICWRSTSSRTSPAIRSAARSRSTISIRSTRILIRNVS